MLSCLRGRAVMRSHNRHTSKTCTCRIRQHMRAHAHVQYDCTRAQTHKHTGHLDSSSARAAIWRSARRCSFAGHDTPKNLSLASSSVSECFWPSRYSYQGCVRTCMYMSHTCVCVQHVCSRYLCACVYLHGALPLGFQGLDISIMLWCWSWAPYSALCAQSQSVLNNHALPYVLFTSRADIRVPPHMY